MASQDEIKQLLAQQQQLAKQKDQLSKTFSDLGSSLSQWMQQQSQLTEALLKTLSASDAEPDVTEKPAQPEKPKTQSLYSPQAQTAGSKPKPKAEQPTAVKSQREEGWEVALGMKWFSRLGIVALLIGFALLLNYSFAFFGKELKLMTAVAVAIGLFFGGPKLKQSMNILGLMLEVGGISIGYLTLFAMCFIPELTVIPTSTGIGWLLLLGYSAGIVALSYKRNSEWLATIAYGYAFFSTSYVTTVQVGYVSNLIILMSSLILTGYKPNWRFLSGILLFVGWLAGFYWYDFAASHSQTISNVTAGQSYAWILTLAYLTSGILSPSKGSALRTVFSIFAGYTLLCLYWHSGLFHLTSAIPADSFLAKHASLEWLMTLTTLAFWIVGQKLNQANNQENQAALLASWTLFLGFATCLEFTGRTTVLFLMLQALVSGLMARFKCTEKNFTYYWLLILSYTLATIATMMLMGMVWWPQNYLPTFLTTVACLGSIFILEYFSWRNNSNRVSLSTIVLTLTLLFYDVYWLLCLPSQYEAIAFSMAGFLMLAIGFIFKIKRIRVCGITQLGIALMHLVVYDLANLPTLFKIITFMLLGVGLLGASYGYGLMLKQLQKSTKE